MSTTRRTGSKGAAPEVTQEVRDFAAAALATRGYRSTAQRAVSKRFGLSRDAAYEVLDLVQADAVRALGGTAALAQVRLTMADVMTAAKSHRDRIAAAAIIVKAVAVSQRVPTHDSNDAVDEYLMGLLDRRSSRLKAAAVDE